MNIGIDLDDTLINCNIIKVTSHEYKFNLNEVKSFDWELSNFPIDLKEEIYKRFTSPFHMCNPPFITNIPNVGNKLHKWRRQGHKLFLMIARSKNIRLESKKLINRIYSRWDKVYFVGLGESKEKLFKKEKLDVWIDDNPKDCDRASKLGIKTYMISNNATPYNFSMKNNKNINVVENFNKVIL